MAKELIWELGLGWGRCGLQMSLQKLERVPSKLFVFFTFFFPELGECHVLEWKDSFVVAAVASIVIAIIVVAVVDTESSVAQAGLKSAIWPRLCLSS